MPINDPLCPRLPPCVYAKETSRFGTSRIHAFRTFQQRDLWVDEDPRKREFLMPKNKAVEIAWTLFTIILHPDNRKNLKL